MFGSIDCSIKNASAIIVILSTVFVRFKTSLDVGMVVAFGKLSLYKKKVIANVTAVHSTF